MLVTDQVIMLRDLNVDDVVGAIRECVMKKMMDCEVRRAPTERRKIDPPI